MELTILNISIAHVIDEIIAIVSLVEEFGHCVDVISIKFFKVVMGRERHADNSVSDVGQVQVKFVVLESFSLPRNQLLNNASFLHFGDF